MTIRAHFRRRRGDFELNARFSIPANGVTAIFGGSGAGKTTVLRAMAGLDHVPGGFLQVGDILWQDGNHFLPTHRRRLGYVFQEPSLFAHLTVQDNLQYGLKRVPQHERAVSWQQATDLLGLENLLLRRPAQLSGGERQRVAIARALAASPKLLLMDEPLASLDRERKMEILPYLETLQTELELPIIYVSHSLEEVGRLAAHLLLLERGHVAANGPLREILTRLDLPLAQSEQAESVIEARVSAHDTEYQLTELEFDGGRFTVTHKPLPVGTRLRLRILARDVSITLKPPAETSILNRFQATVDTMMPHGPSQTTVRMLAGTTPILARITRKSADILALRPGQKVYAQAKSVAVLS